MKSFDTELAAKMLLPVKDKFKAVLCLQNGVENEKKIAGFIGEDKVIGGSVTSAIERLDSGQATLEKKRGIGITNSHTLSRSIVDEFNAAGLNAKLFPNLMDLKWSKMLSNLLGNATSAILNMTPAEVFGSPEVYKIEYLEMMEAVNVMEGLGIHVVNLPGVPMRLLLLIMLRLPNTDLKTFTGKSIRIWTWWKDALFSHRSSFRQESLRIQLLEWGNQPKWIDRENTDPGQ